MAAPGIGAERNTASGFMDQVREGLQKGHLTESLQNELQARLRRVRQWGVAYEAIDFSPDMKLLMESAVPTRVPTC